MELRPKPGIYDIRTKISFTDFIRCRILDTNETNYKQIIGQGEGGCSYTVPTSLNKDLLEKQRQLMIHNHL